MLTYATDAKHKKRHRNFVETDTKCDAGLSLSLVFAFQTTFNIFSPYARLKRNL